MSQILKSRLMVLNYLDVCGVSNSNYNIPNSGPDLPIVGLYASIPSNSGNTVYVRCNGTNVISSLCTGIYTMLDDNDPFSLRWHGTGRNYTFNWGSNSPTGNSCGIYFFVLREDFLDYQLSLYPNYLQTILGNGVSLVSSQSSQLSNINSFSNDLKTNFFSPDLKKAIQYKDRLDVTQYATDEIKYVSNYIREENEY